jgi:hypothetical protein
VQSIIDKEAVVGCRVLDSGKTLVEETTLTSNEGESESNMMIYVTSKSE